MKAQTTAHPSLAIVGAGRVGGALTLAARGAGISCELHGRDREPGALAAAQVVLLCVPDDLIGAVAAEIGNEISPGAIVGHTSGATPVMALEPLSDNTEGLFGLHPLQTIPTARTELRGVPCAISASRPDVAERARDIASGLGLAPFEIAEERRAIYHAAASIASNFLFALEESAAQLLGQAGVAEPRRVLGPLVSSSSRNWVETGSTALTGPIARGDERTIERHRAAISAEAPELLPLYDILGERTRELAATEGATS